MMRSEILNKIQKVSSNKINLANLQITDEEIAEIMLYMSLANPQIIELNLDRNQLTDTGAIILKDKLKLFENLSTLSLQYNEIDEPGVLALFSLNKNIFFHGNKITDQGEMDRIQHQALQK
jgi:hypothetical protein